MKRSLYNTGNRDDNEPEITAILDRYHIPYRQGKPGDGYDLIILAPGGVRLWEVKNPEQPPSKRKLTDIEISTRDWCKIAGIPYEVLETAEEAAEICRKSPPTPQPSRRIRYALHVYLRKRRLMPSVAVSLPLTRSAQQRTWLAASRMSLALNTATVS